MNIAYGCSTVMFHMIGSSIKVRGQFCFALGIILLFSRSYVSCCGDGCQFGRAFYLQGRFAHVFLLFCMCPCDCLARFVAHVSRGNHGLLPGTVAHTQTYLRDSAKPAFANCSQHRTFTCHCSRHMRSKFQRSKFVVVVVASQLLLPV